MDGYTLSISRCSGGDGVEESFKAKIKRREQGNWDGLEMRARRI